ncbi:orotidine-5'-phosphate decarboxylase [Pontibacillus yanchengensis]|uniref:Orotidine 5'-phosphate decarboxylase n=1 Tax=Pontibacillus yanchengensis Y32 TaxID=1385514 RepID=A0A0A2TQ26_9BACI|nr:orotidine-5'-phosphate decarboxylase [Pontibacillus yanchengensis]KGP71385.1 orotidine 5'-phosphate decarboxylase [Pontibacillus yanchengensis Y32]
MLDSQPLFLALDFQSAEEALTFLDTHQLHHIPVKVGMELFYREGSSIIEALNEREHPIFLDLKLHDIPNTVKQAMKSLASLNIDVINVHASGGKNMMEAAQEGLHEGTKAGQDKPLLLAVTQLTSSSEEMLHNELLIPHQIEKVVTHYAQMAKEANVDGVVCSVAEASIIAEVCGDSFYRLTPGIRLKDQPHQDQVRIATPEKARKAGASAIVVGRGVTTSESPQKAYQQYMKEWKHGHKTTLS